MKALFFFLLVICGNISLSAQRRNKPPIDSSTFGKWPFVSYVRISNDGKYAAYMVGDTMDVRAYGSAWKFSTKAYLYKFTGDSRRLIFGIPGDSVGILELGIGRIDYIPGVDRVKLPEEGSGDWLAYRQKASGLLILRHLLSGKSFGFASARNFVFNRSGDALVFDANDSLVWLHPGRERGRTIWRAKEGDATVGEIVFSGNGTAVAFVAGDRQGQAVWYYADGTDSAVLLADNRSPGIDKGLSIEDINYQGFIDNSRLLVELKEAPLPQPKEGAVKVDIWSGTDPALMSQQLNNLKPRSYAAVLAIPDGHIVRLEQEDEKIIGHYHDHALLMRSKSLAGIFDEWYWNKAAQSSVYLVSLRDGTRKPLGSGLPLTIATAYRFSPEGKFVIYYDAVKKNYFSYEIASGITRNITAGIRTNWTAYEKSDIPSALYMPISGGGGWIKGDKAVFLYDQFDIFRADTRGQHPPVNLTNGYGRKKNIAFRLAMESTSQEFDAGATLILSGFNRITKDDGFFSIRLGDGGAPRLLTMQPCVFKGTWEDDRNIPVEPITAHDARVYLVRRMTAEESPNYFWTTDFKTFTALTDVHPERNYNWITSELVTWKTQDGNVSQGVLYKPENLDPHKKYPLIFHYYERYSEGLHGFLNPGYNNGVLNVPYYVSNGYLVFLPDIHYQLGHPGRSVVNTIVSAAQYLAKLPYVDAARMGIQGHSRGGWETNFLVTHTHLFAAAMSSSGMADYVSLYDGVRDKASGASRQIGFDILYQRIGATLWERPDLYVENSPIFKANEVTTPLLMMANKEDPDVPFEQGVEFFTALRRLGKKVWMLQYDGQGHLVSGDAAKDLTMRVQQFFDHYLKGRPAPLWMTRGIPARMKGVDNGLELDESEIEP